MALRNIMNYKQDDVLRKKSREIDNINDRIIALLDDMAETMYEDNGVGLAAPQVGILKRIAVIDTGDGLIEAINPKIVKSSGEQTGEEGCLSIPGVTGLVTRPMNVVVEALNRKGELFTVKAKGLLARAFCHEIDHLDGVLFIDKMIRETTGDEK